MKFRINQQITAKVMTGLFRDRERVKTGKIFRLEQLEHGLMISFQTDKEQVYHCMEAELEGKILKAN